MDIIENTSVQAMRHNARVEVERDLRRQFFENHKFFWWELPMHRKYFEVLIAASKSITNGACKGGLIMQNGRPNGHMSLQAYWLSNNGYLGEYGTSKEFEPTLLGWATLDAFAKDRACFPPEIQRSLREFYEGTPSCSKQTNDSPNQEGPVQKTG